MTWGSIYNNPSNIYKVYFSSIPILPLFATFREKGPRPKWNIYKNVLDNSKKCLSVGNVRILPIFGLLFK